VVAALHRIPSRVRTDKTNRSVAIIEFRLKAVARVKIGCWARRVSSMGGEFRGRRWLRWALGRGEFPVLAESFAFGWRVQSWVGEFRVCSATLCDVRVRLSREKIDKTEGWTLQRRVKPRRRCPSMCVLILRLKRCILTIVSMATVCSTLLFDGDVDPFTKTFTSVIDPADTHMSCTFHCHN